jgi:hypothetical protein
MLVLQKSDGDAESTYSPANDGDFDFLWGGHDGLLFEKQ